jgi:hypothetical protein
MTRFSIIAHCDLIFVYPQNGATLLDYYKVLWSEQ